MRPKLSYLGIFGIEFEKTIVIFEIRTLEVIKIERFMLNKNKLNLGAKLPYLCIFWLKFKKSILIFESATTEFGLDDLTDEAVRSWVQITVKANFLQLIQFHLIVQGSRFNSTTFQFNYCLRQSSYTYIYI